MLTGNKRKREDWRTVASDVRTLVKGDWNKKSYMDAILRTHIETFGWGMKILYDNEDGTFRIATISSGDAKEEESDRTYKEVTQFVYIASRSLQTYNFVQSDQSFTVYNELEAKLGLKGEIKED